MKANKAPEKLYLFEGEPILSARSKKVEGTCIEYTRTDAFIEKAEMFFEENIEEEGCKIGYSEWIELRSNYESLDSFIRAFRNYMNGE